jgi:hypothetical protein
MSLDVACQGRLQELLVNFDLHELPPMAFRAFNPDLGSLFQQISLVAQGPPSDRAAFLEQVQR